MRHINIPIFIPHLGCPNMCVFCNQRTISGIKEFHIDEVKSIIDEALTTVGRDDEAEIAFFGGSFTGIDRNLMIDLLSIGNRYIKEGRIQSIRCSTRPDYIDSDILGILREYGVKTIELGLQSVSDKVLLASKRGHTFEDEIRACRLIRENGFSLIGQMMVGLPNSTLEDELNTAKFIIDSGAAGARIYPTVVFCDTELEKMSKEGIYKPLSLDDALDRSAEIFAMFEESGVPVIRLGLCASENLSSEETYYAGPNHPAIGELTVNKYYFDKILSEAKKKTLSPNHIVKVFVSKGSAAKAIGQKKKNKILLKEALGVKDVIIKESEDIEGYRIKFETEVQQCI